MDFEYASGFVAYDSETGVFTWLKRDISIYNRLQSATRFNNTFVGKRADNLCPCTGYRRIGIRLNGYNKHIKAHRLAWFMFYGETPKQIDHINGDRSDNRISNLRSVEKEENSKNLGLSKRNTSGTSGVSFCNTRKKWCAKGLVGRTRKHLGYFSTKQEAIDARSKFETEMGYHPNHGARTGWVRDDDR
jgi:hypothetical protein